MAGTHRDKQDTKHPYCPSQDIQKSWLILLLYFGRFFITVYPIGKAGGYLHGPPGRVPRLPQC